MYFLVKNCNFYVYYGVESQIIAQRTLVQFSTSCSTSSCHIIKTEYEIKRTELPNEQTQEERS